MNTALSCRVVNQCGTVKLGTGVETFNEFINAFGAEGISVSPWAREMLERNNIEISLEKTNIDLMVASNAELGFKRGAVIEDTYACILESGGGLLPAEAGIQMLLQGCGSLKKGIRYLIAMEPLFDSRGHRNIFVISRDNGSQYLGDSYGYPNYRYDSDVEFIFRGRI